MDSKTPRSLFFSVFLVASPACSSSSSSPSAPTDAGADTAVETSALDSSADALAEGGDDGGDGGGCVSGLTQPNAACQTCQDAHCCIVASDCAKTGSKWSCSAAKVCRENDCATECGLAAPTCGDIIPDPASCTDATRAKCCSQLSACAKSDECLAMIYMCIDEMSCDPSKPCFAKCRTDWPAGAVLFDALDKCSQKVSCP